MNMIPNASRIWHRLWSMRLIILSTVYSAAAGAWAVIPADWQPDLSSGAKLILAGIGVAIPALAAVSRLVDQPKLYEPTPTASQPDDNADHA